MSGPFEGVARVAIAEIIQQHAQTSKFGLVLSQEGFERAVGDLFALLQTSRTLKAAGDRMLGGPGSEAQTSSAKLPSSAPQRRRQSNVSSQLVDQKSGLNSLEANESPSGTEVTDLTSSRSTSRRFDAASGNRPRMQPRWWRD